LENNSIKENLPLLYVHEEFIKVFNTLRFIEIIAKKWFIKNEMHGKKCIRV
jgi:hypothetical protein